MPARRLDGRRGCRVEDRSSAPTRRAHPKAAAVAACGVSSWADDDVGGRATEGRARRGRPSARRWRPARRGCGWRRRRRPRSGPRRSTPRPLGHAGASTRGRRGWPRGITEVVVAEAADDRHAGTEPGRHHRLVGALAAEAPFVTGGDEGLTSLREALAVGDLVDVQRSDDDDRTPPQPVIDGPAPTIPPRWWHRSGGRGDAEGGEHGFDHRERVAAVRRVRGDDEVGARHDDDALAEQALGRERRRRRSASHHCRP